MNVIQLVNNRSWGGGERYVFDLTQQLVAHGHNVRLITKGAPAVDSEFVSLGVEVTHARLGGVLDFASAGVIAGVIDSLDNDEPVVIHAHNFKTAIAAVRAKKRLAGKRRVSVVVTRHLIKKAGRSVIDRWVYRNIDALVFISQAVKDEFMGAKAPIDPAKTHIIYNSIPTPPAITPSPATDDRVRLTFMGRLSKEKGIDMLLESLAMVKVSGWQMLIGGTGDEQYVKTLMDKAQTLGIADKITWLGYVADVWPVIGRTDVGVVPSVWREPFGLTILEFISRGVPVVSTDSGAQKEILTDGKDSLLTSVDADSFAAALERIITDANLRRQLGQNALETFRRFDYNVFYNRFSALYRSLCG